MPVTTRQQAQHNTEIQKVKDFLMASVAEFVDLYPDTNPGNRQQRIKAQFDRMWGEE